MQIMMRTCCCVQMALTQLFTRVSSAHINDISAGSSRLQPRPSNQLKQSGQSVGVGKGHAG